MLNDSGKREEFSTGAVRDTQENKGRCDLLPLDCLPRKYANDPIILLLDKFKQTGNFKFIEDARECFIAKYFPDVETSLLELSIHYQEGAAKYGDNNWQKGLPVSRYISSAIRHYVEYRRGDKNEPHQRSFVWNLTAIIWTCKHLPTMNDYTVCGYVIDKKQNENMIKDANKIGGAKPPNAYMVFCAMDPRMQGFRADYNPFTNKPDK